MLFRSEITDDEGRAVLDMALEKLEDIRPAQDLDPAAIDDILEETRAWINALKARCKESEIPPKRLFRTLRIALTGRTSGPELVFLLAGLGRDAVGERLEAAREFAAR